ncbi:MAG: hypothetical protein HOA25_08625 [Gammaproteobacteria bacterium]|nr:hypothetical protein [Gammaproteobacteria bacterium]
MLDLTKCPKAQRPLIEVLVSYAMTSSTRALLQTGQCPHRRTEASRTIVAGDHVLVMSIGTYAMSEIVKVGFLFSSAAFV